MTYGRADTLEERLGLKPLVGQRIAPIIIFAASIEHHLERRCGSSRASIQRAFDPRPTRR
ncbi:MAG: hypothetical protein E5V28_04880 [Mesorhizobium sp.]|nr:MAG: hypothetical protein E5V28_04880 [Mesorhizobium sp.]